MKTFFHWHALARRGTPLLAVAAALALVVPVLAQSDAPNQPLPTTEPFIPIGTQVPLMRPPTATPVAAAPTATAVPASDTSDADASAPEVVWVQTDRPATLWSSADDGATAVMPVNQWRYFQVTQPIAGGRAAVREPRTGATGWLDASRIGPVGAPPSDYLQAPPADDTTMNVPARISGDTDLFDHPARADYFSLDSMKLNDSVIVIGSVKVADATWYHLDSGAYAPSSKVRVPDPPSQFFTGRWIDASLTEPVIVTAYQDSTPIYAALAVKGTTAFQTPTGTFKILRRVADETMDSETLYPPIPRDGPGGYHLEHVLDTQYFTNDGASIHYNYWYANWGYSGSHGCLGMNMADAQFFWNFAGVGTTVSIHT